VAQGGDKADIPNVVFRHKGEIVHSQTSLIENLDTLAFPDWQALGLEQYLPLLILNTTRGCPYACAFCAHNYVWGYRPDASDKAEQIPFVRRKSFERVQQEIERSQRELGVHLYGFADSTLPTRLTLELSEWLAGRRPRVIWAGFGMVNQFSAEDMGMLAASGCVSLWIGVESGDERMLRRMGKTYSRGDIVRTFRDMAKAGIRGIPGFVIGFPGEDDRSIASTLSLIPELGADVHVVSPFILDPGSPVSRRPERYDVVLQPDWECKIVGRGYTNEFEIPYYQVNGVPNTLHWQRLGGLSGYLGWDEDRNIAESEYATVLARARDMSVQEFFAEVNAAFRTLDEKKLRAVIRRTWRAMRNWR
jgi:radical SAM superfamily enzyme YgiQ (UPF0313 family)